MRSRIGSGVSTPGPTTTCASRSRSRNSWPASGPSPATAARPPAPVWRSPTWWPTWPPGEVLPRHRIYEKVWDERYAGLSNTLEVHVMELRKKLEAHGPRLIHTLRHRGYRLGAEPEETA